MSNKLFKYIYFTIVFLIIFAGAFPALKWRMEPFKELNIYILDKTVPDESYREHKGLMWVLNANKYTLDKKRPFDIAEDYFGFVPLGDNQYDIRYLPDDIQDAELIYITDTYGVYEEEFNGLNEEGQRSVKVYGGLTKSDIASIKKSLYENHGTLVAEFNTFGSPSGISEKIEMYDLMGFEWTGWIGRYFIDLKKDYEVPVWAIDNYEKQYGEVWPFSGEGYIFVDDSDRIVVMEAEEDVIGKGIQIHFDEQYIDIYGVEKDVYYSYWFDIIAPYEETEVIATYNMELTHQGMEKFKEIGVETNFPAVVKYEDPRYTSYYFAGDFSDMSHVTEFYNFYGLDWVKKVFSIDSRYSDIPFFWKVYVPLMKTILAEVYNDTRVYEDYVVEYVETPTYNYNTRVNEKYFEVFRNGQWEEIQIKGVNLGMGKPGFFPGEGKIAREEYIRWFEQIQEMNANAIRVYTINPPDFYNALYEYNRRAETPLYIFHGIWVEEEEFMEVDSIYNEHFVETIKHEIEYTIDLIHGNLELEPRKGHASGKYSYDVSEYIIGWIFGIEWDSNVVLHANETIDVPLEMDLDHLSTTHAEAFEVWLAEMMSYTLEYEIEQYQWSRPISFTNWPTTDILEHPSEPFVFEDLAEVDPNTIKAADSYEPGVFASYHIYPNYPDFMNLDEDYLEYVSNGKPNAYAGYLNELRSVHHMPVIVAEFGVPSSRGIGRGNPNGYDQGHNTEITQGEKNKELFYAIMDEGYAGALLFAWQDEWFKKSWNLEQFDDPQTRAYWANVQTYEEQYGMLAFDSSLENTLLLDGNDDWDGIESLIEKTDTINAGMGSINSLKMASDEKYLYLKLDLEGLSSPDFWNDYEAIVSFDVIPQQGSGFLNKERLQLHDGTDFILRIDGNDNTRLLVDPYYDPFLYLYGESYDVLDDYVRPEKESGEFSPIYMIQAYMIQNENTIIPDTAEVLPTKYFETGRLVHGSDDPSSELYSTLADFIISYDQGFIEIQLPWMLLNAKDPSDREFMADLWSDGLESSIAVDGIGISVQTIDKETKKQHDFGPYKGLRVDETLYEWEEWDLPEYTERLKDSYEIMKEVFGGF